MSNFTSPIVVMKETANTWRIYRDLIYYVGKEGSSDVIIVPEGFVTDFASVPRLFWSLLPPDGEYTGAAIVHDYLYSEQKRSRFESDNIFLEAMGVLKVNFFIRNIMYGAVRAFGWIPWGKRAK